MAPVCMCPFWGNKQIEGFFYHSHVEMKKIRVRRSCSLPIEVPYFDIIEYGVHAVAGNYKHISVCYFIEITMLAQNYCILKHKYAFLC